MILGMVFSLSSLIRLHSVYPKLLFFSLFLLDVDRSKIFIVSERVEVDDNMLPILETDKSSYSSSCNYSSLSSYIFSIDMLLFWFCCSTYFESSSIADYFSSSICSWGVLCRCLTLCMLRLMRSRLKAICVAGTLRESMNYSSIVIWVRGWLRLLGWECRSRARTVFLNPF